VVGAKPTAWCTLGQSPSKTGQEGAAGPLRPFSRSVSLTTSWRSAVGRGLAGWGHAVGPEGDISTDAVVGLMPARQVPHTSAAGSSRGLGGVAGAQQTDPRACGQSNHMKLLLS
jgi:hypothetical protein